jgi:hypothetical protein
MTMPSMIGMMLGDSSGDVDPPTTAPTVQPSPSTPAPTMDLLQNCVDDTIALYANSLGLRLAFQKHRASVSCDGKQTECELELDRGGWPGATAVPGRPFRI